MAAERVLRARASLRHRAQRRAPSRAAPALIRFEGFPQRRYLYDGADGPPWERLPALGATRAFELPDGLALLRAQDIRAVLRDARFVHWNLRALERDPGVDRGFIERRRQQLTGAEGADHARLRRLTGPVLSARAMQSHRDLMRGVLAELLRAAAGGPFEADAALCRPYPMRVMCALMGLPAADAGFLGDVAQDWIAWQTGSVSAVPRALAAYDALEAYLAPAVEARRGAHGGADLIGLLLRAESQGDRLSAPEVARMAAGTLAAGVESTRCALATALYLFGRHAEQWRLLARDAALVEPAVDEVLRMLPPFPVVARTAIEDAEVNGLAIPAGTKLYLCLIAAGRDPDLYDDPRRFDITRAGTPPQLAFGAGGHACIGVHLAKLELQEALRVLRDAVERIDIEEQPSWRSPSEVLQGPSRLVLRLTPR